MDKIQSILRTVRPGQWLMAVIVALTFFANNSYLEPDIMESRNLVTAREMVEKGNYIVPTMNDELRFEKPPLPTWISAAVETVSPDDIAAQRAVAAIFGILLVVFVYRLCRDVLDIDPVWAVIFLCTCYNFMLMARTVSWDIYCHAFMMGGIYFFSRALTRPGRCWRAFLLAGLFTGLSIMSKGPVSLFALFIPYIIAFCFCYRPSMRGKWLPLAAMVVNAVIVGGWWYVYIHLNYADELQAMMDRETGAWIGRNVRPWHYYKTFFLEAGLWAPMLITSIIIVAKRWRTMGGRRVLVPILWMAVCLVLLSCMPEKKNRYLFPLLIPAAMLMSQTVGYWTHRFSAVAVKRKISGAFRLNCWIMFMLAGALPIVAFVMLVLPGHMGIVRFVTFCALCAVCVYSLFKAISRLLPERMVYATGILFAGAVAIAMPSVFPLFNNADMTGLGLTVGDPRLEGIPFRYDSREELRIELVYMARRDIRPIDTGDTAALRRAVPFALLRHHGAAGLPQQFLNNVDTLNIGVFDCNRRPEGTRRYSPDFIYNLTLITAPTDEQNR